MQIHELNDLTTALATGTYVAVDTGSTTRKLDYTALAKAIIENYNGSTLDGKAQTVQAALNSVTGALNGAEVRKVLTGAAIGAQASGAGDMGLTIYGKSTQTGTPTTSNPATIATAGASGSISVVAVGKNVVPYPYITSSVTKSGITFTAMSDGRVRVSGTATDNNATYKLADTDAVKAVLVVGQRYKVTTYDGGNSGYGPYDDCWFQVYSDDGGIIGNDRGYNEFTWQGSNNCDMDIRVANGKTVNTVVCPMVRLIGAADAAYEPYQSQTVTLSTPNALAGIPVTSGGNYTDASNQQWFCDTISGGKLTKRNHVLTDVSGTLDDGVYISTGHTNLASGYITFAYAIKNLGTLPSAANSEMSSICSHLVYDNSLFGNHTPGTFVIQASAAGWLRIYACMPSADYASLADDAARVAAFKAWWTNNSVVAIVPYYKYGSYAEEYTVTDLSSAQATALSEMQSYDGGTSVYTTDAAQPDIRAKIFVDAAAYI